MAGGFGSGRLAGESVEDYLKRKGDYDWRLVQEEDDGRDETSETPVKQSSE